MMDKQFLISIKTVLFAVALVGVGYVLYHLRTIIGILLVATLIVISLEGAVQRILKFRFIKSRSVAVIISYVVIVGTIIGIATVGVPPFLTQIQKLLLSLSKIEQQFNILASTNFSLTDLIPNTANLSKGVLSVTISIFSNIATVFSLLVISIYMSIDWPHIKQRIVSFLPETYQDAVEDTFTDIESNVSQWVKGELLLMLVIGLFSFLGLIVLDVSYPLALGLIAGLLEIVPIIGPVISAILAGIIGFSASPVKGIGVIALFTIIQQLENNILVPKVMGKVSGFSPLVILLALMVGSTLFGIVGAILAIPMTMILAIILKRALRYSN